MGRVAQPQDLLLKLGQALEPAFDRQVAARHHHTNPLRCHGGQQELGEVGKALAGLDLEDDAGRGATSPKKVLQQPDVLHALGEGESDHVCLPDDEPEQGLVQRAQGGKP